MNLLLALFITLSGSCGDPPSMAQASTTQAVVGEATDEVRRFYTRFSQPIPQLLVGDETVTPCDLCVDGSPKAAYVGARYAQKRLPVERWDEFRKLTQSNLFARLLEVKTAPLAVLAEIEHVLIVDLEPYDLVNYLDSELAYENHPEAGAILRVSVPVVNSDASQAVVYAELTMVHTLDRRFYLLAKDADDEWIVQWVAPVFLLAE